MYNQRLSKSERKQIKQVRKLAPVLGYSQANKIVKATTQKREQYDYNTQR